MTTATEPRRASATSKRSFQTKMLIDGRWVESRSGQTFDTVNPATEETIAQVAEGDKADIDLAVNAARKAFDSGPWRTMDARDRGRLMNRFADLIEKNIDELAELETLDNGKPISESRHADLPFVVDCFRYYAGWADKIHGQTDPDPGELLLLHEARASRRRRADHPLELPDADDRLEVGAGPRRRLHDRPQARRTDPALGPPAWRTRDGGRLPGGRDQHRPRLR